MSNCKIIITFSEENLFDSESEEDFPVISSKTKNSRHKDERNESADSETVPSSQPSRNELYAAKMKADFMIPNIDTPPPINNICMCLIILH